MKNRLPHSGFTLLEILVVTAIIMIVTSFVAFKFNRGSGAPEAAERLVLQFEAARDEAIAKGRVIGWSSDGAGYQFWLQNERLEWEPIQNNDALRNTRLGEGVQISSQFVNQQQRPLGERVLFPSDGVIEPFQIQIVAGEQKLRVGGDVMGRFALLDFDASATAKVSP
ncbi:type II secretion system minor pseudopilin GspH [Chitinibacter bivalviorum]|uniref:Type II secretion system protein H n=1 Tax=Chitinibacter bivalviorum TaxID=2739434 RepID=A0A7H9BQJ2_9NEIS|nr:type II secretion system minor pseudopilin GspH [Chitinibacter bivalviorum]QLG89514.1 type II secretion system minor pseudopilin GspH [Chitinibacter bivalviorum]